MGSDRISTLKNVACFEDANIHKPDIKNVWLKLLFSIFLLSLILFLASCPIFAADNNSTNGENLSSNLPQKYDLRLEGKLTPVKDQGNLSTCWIFATYGSLESTLLPGENMNFSENNMKDLCSYLNLKEGFDRNWTYNPCVLFPYGFGGGYEMSTAYLVRADGPVNATSDPYNTSSGISPTGLKPEKWVQETIIIPGRKDSLDNNQIKEAIKKYGAVASSMRSANFTDYYNNQTYSFYYFGSYDPSQYSPDHAIDIVGWDDNYDKNKFNYNFEPPGNGAFIIRNSWGSNWGDGGYFYMSYYDRVLAKMDNYVFNASPVTYNNVWYYDPYGMVSSNYFLPQTTWWISNFFTAPKSEKLAAVSFYTLAPNTNYEVYVYLNPQNNNPINGTLAGKENGTISTMGFKTIIIAQQVALKTNDSYSIVVKLTTPNRKETKIAVEYPVPNYSSRAWALIGQSYVSLNGVNWQDLNTLYWDGKVWRALLPNGNVCLKAFTLDGGDPVNVTLAIADNPQTATLANGLADNLQPAPLTVAGGLAGSSEPIFYYDLNTGRSLYMGPQTNHTNWTYQVNDVISTTPAIASDGTIYFGSADNNLYALNPNGEFKWQFTTGNSIWSSPTVAADGTVYFGGGDGYFYALDSQGNLKWNYDTSSPILGDIIWSSPAIGTDGSVYFGGADGSFYALDSQGNLKWRYDIGDEIYSSPSIAKDGTVYFGCDMFYHGS